MRAAQLALTLLSSNMLYAEEKCAYDKLMLALLVIVTLFFYLNLRFDALKATIMR